jgi:uncharacterized protein (DUF2141 family)
VTVGLVLLAGIAQAQPEAMLSVDVHGLHSAKGQVLCFLYADAGGFPTDPARAMARTSAAIGGRTATCGFRGLAPGAYAVAVVHDENGNGRLDRNLMGIPAEGVGASNNPKSRFGPPKFDQARFTYPGGAMNLAVEIHYF